MQRSSLFFFLISMMAAPGAGMAGAAQTGTTAPGGVEALKAAQQRYLEALNRRDAAGVAGLWHANYSEFSESGDRAESWAGRGAEARAGYWRAEFARYAEWRVEYPVLEAVVAGGTGIVNATQKVTQRPKDGVLEYLRTRVSYTWTFEDGRWQLLTAHRSAPPASAPGGALLGKDAGEERVLKTVLGLPRWAGVPLVDGRLLRLLAESLDAKNVVEVGTSTGFGSLWLANALRKTGGHLTTFEIDAGRAATARRQFELAGVEGLITLVEGDAHEKVSQVKGPIDLLFLDADKDGYLDYFRKLAPLVRPGGLIVSHNMRFPAPDAAYVKAITTDPALETVFLNMDDQGAGVTLKKR